MLDDGKVVAAYVELTSKPSGATTDTVYGIVSAAKGTVKVGDEYKSEYTVSNNNQEYTVYMPTSATIAKGDIVSFELASDNIYGNGDVTVYTTSNAKYIDELDKDNVLSYYDTIGGSVVTKALDDDAQIVYVNQDKDTAGEDIGVGEYDSITNYANAVVVLDSNGSKVVAIIVESSGECNVVNASLTLKNQVNGSNGAWTAAKTDDSATFTVSAKNIADGTVKVTWYTDNTYANTTTAPANLTVSGNNLASGTATITMTENGTTVTAGTYYLSLIHISEPTRP